MRHPLGHLWVAKKQEQQQKEEKQPEEEKQMDEKQKEM